MPRGETEESGESDDKDYDIDTLDNVQLQTTERSRERVVADYKVSLSRSVVFQCAKHTCVETRYVEFNYITRPPKLLYRKLRPVEVTCEHCDEHSQISYEIPDSPQRLMASQDLVR